MFNISVCDDSPIFLQITTEFIHKWSRERNIPVMISTFENGDELLSHHREEPADIIFLDIISPCSTAWRPQKSCVRPTGMQKSSF